MKIQLIMTGKTSVDFVRKGMEEYSARLKHYLPFQMEIIPDIKSVKGLPADLLKEKEGSLILRALQRGDCVVLADERGAMFTSREFAAYLDRKMQTVPKRLVFVIGGAFGFSQQVYDASHEQIALSKMTLSGQLTRLVFLEQLYRAFTILNHEPYHHE
jgi:23S rRNA (pseudouridine1915-N3)-methyltransferase